MSKLKSVIKVATDAVRKAAEQRQSDAALRAHGGAQGESPQVAPLRLQVLLMQQCPAASLLQTSPVKLSYRPHPQLPVHKHTCARFSTLTLPFTVNQVLEMSKERDELVEKVRTSAQREANAVHLIEAARASEVDAQQQLWAVRQELADIKSAERERKLRESAARARYTSCRTRAHNARACMSLRGEYVCVHAVCSLCLLCACHCGCLCVNACVRTINVYSHTRCDQASVRISPRYETLLCAAQQQARAETRMCGNVTCGV